MSRHLLDKAILLKLDHRYRLFVETLPRNLAQLASNRKTFKGNGPSQPVQTVADFGDLVSGPWVFGDAFPGLGEERLLGLGESWMFLGGAILIRDHLVDGQLSATQDAAELQRRMMNMAEDILHLLMGDHPVFWKRFEQYKRQVEVALQLETYYRTSSLAAYDLAAAWHIGAAKSGLFKVIPWAMVILTDTPLHFASIEASIDSYAAGGQLMDDIADWREDLARGNYTYPLAQAIGHLHNSDTEVSHQAVEALFLNSTLMKDLVTQAKAWLQQALTIANGVPCQAWISHLYSAIEEFTWYHHWVIIYRIAEAARQRKGCE